MRRDSTSTALCPARLGDARHAEVRPGGESPGCRETAGRSAKQLGGPQQSGELPKWSPPYLTRELAEQALPLAAKGELEPHTVLSLGKYGERWPAACQHRTVDDDRQRWRRFVATRPIAEMGLDQIKPGHIKRFTESVSRTRKQVPMKGSLQPLPWVPPASR